MTDESPKIAALIEKLRAGTFEALLSAEESNWFEAKDQPYLLDKEFQKLELAKDVSAFANSGGGLLIIGAKSEPLADRAVEVVKTVNPFAASLIDLQQYRDVIEAHVWPAVRGLGVFWCPGTTDTSRGIAYIHVPPQDAEDEPFLVSKALATDQNIRGNMFGFYERHRDKVTYKDAKDFHYLVRAGRSVLRLEERIDSIESLLAERAASLLASAPHVVAVDADADADKPGRADSLEPPLAARATSPAAPAPHKGAVDIDKRVADAIFLAKIHDQCAIALSATFVVPVAISGLFSSRQSPVAQLLKSPPQIRQSGFTIDAGGSVSIVEGTRLQSLLVEEGRVLETWRDGTTIFVAPGDGRFLCWGRHQGPPLIINPIVLIESIYEFCLLIQQLQKHARPENCGVDIQLHLRAKVGEQELHLGPGPVGRYSRWRMAARPAPLASVRLEEVWAKGEIDVPVLAYSIAAKAYTWFGLTLDEIPYTTGYDDEGRIDADQLINSKDG